MEHRVVAHRQAMKMRAQKCDGVPAPLERESGVEEAGVLSDWRLEKRRFLARRF